eukprot:gene12305-25876_t
MESPIVLPINDIFQLLPDSVCVLDTSGKILIANKEFEENVVSMKRGANYSFVGDIIHNEDKDIFNEALKKSSDNKSKSITSPVRTLTCEQASDFPIYRRYIWSLTGELGSGRTIAVGRVVNALENSKEKNSAEFLDFFKNAPTPLHWISPTGIILWANNAELEVLGYTAEEYIGQPIAKFCPDEEAMVLVIFTRTPGDTKTVKDTPVRFRTKSGEIK